MLKRFFISGMMMVAVLVVLAGSLWMFAPAHAQDPCPLPEGYLETMLIDLEETGQRIGEVDTTDPAEISVFYVQVYQLRHRYENMTMDIPDCGMRAHALFTNILGNWEDILGLALATHANPAAAQDYVNEIAVLTDRIQFFTPFLLNIAFPPVIPTPEPTPTEVVVLQTFYVSTQGLNVRAGPGAEFEALGVLTGGTPIQVVTLDTLDNGDVWYQILFDDAPDGVGWVFGTMISSERPAEFPEPISTFELPTSTPRPTPN